MGIYSDTNFWCGLAERAVKTGAQAAIAVLGTDAAGVIQADWRGVLAAVGGAVLLSVLTSISLPDQAYYTGGSGRHVADVPVDSGPAVSSVESAVGALYPSDLTE